jgi:hypothetical protein
MNVNEAFTRSATRVSPKDRQNHNYSPPKGEAATGSNCCPRPLYSSYCVSVYAKKGHHAPIITQTRNGRTATLSSLAQNKTLPDNWTGDCCVNSGQSNKAWTGMLARGKRWLDLDPTDVQPLPRKSRTAVASRGHPQRHYSVQFINTILGS